MRDHLAGTLGEADTAFHAARALFGGEHCGIRSVLNVDQDRAHLGRRLLGLFGQVAHLAGHDGKALALLARLGRFDRSIDRQDVRLVGDIGHAGNDFANLLCLFRQGQDVLGDALDLAADHLHAVQDGIDRFGPFLPDAQRVRRKVGDFGGLGCRLLRRRLGLAHRRTDLVDRSRLLIGAGGVFADRGQDLG